MSVVFHRLVRRLEVLTTIVMCSDGFGGDNLSLLKIECLQAANQARWKPNLEGKNGSCEHYSLQPMEMLPDIQDR